MTKTANDEYTKDPEFDRCAECRMLVKTGEYHPYAACVLYKQLGQADKVTSCLNSVIEYAHSRASALAPQGVAELLDAALRVPAHAEGYIRRAIEMLASTPVTAPVSTGEQPPRCVKCGHDAGIERTLKRCKARIDGGEALCQCHCVFPAATSTTPDGEREL